MAVAVAVTGFRLKHLKKRPPPKKTDGSPATAATATGILLVTDFDFHDGRAATNHYVLRTLAGEYRKLQLSAPIPDNRGSGSAIRVEYRNAPSGPLRRHLKEGGSSGSSSNGGIGSGGSSLRGGVEGAGPSRALLQAGAGAGSGSGLLPPGMELQVASLDFISVLPTPTTSGSGGSSSGSGGLVVSSTPLKAPAAGGPGTWWFPQAQLASLPGNTSRPVADTISTLVFIVSMCNHGAVAGPEVSQGGGLGGMMGVGSGRGPGRGVRRFGAAVYAGVVPGRQPVFLLSGDQSPNLIV